MTSSIWNHIYIYISSSKKDFASHYMDLWHLNQNKNKLVQNLFKSKLLYGSETWTMSKQLEKRLDGTNTRLLMRVQNINWKHFTLEQIYVSLPKASHAVRMRRNCFAGHCLRAKKEIMSDLLFQSLQRQKKGGKPISYPETLVKGNDTYICDMVEDNGELKSLEKTC